ANSFNGNGATDLNGYLYFPKGALTYNGNNTTNSTCMRIVADTIKMTGSSKLKSDCSAELGGREDKEAGPPYYSRCQQGRLTATTEVRRKDQRRGLRTAISPTRRSSR